MTQEKTIRRYKRNYLTQEFVYLLLIFLVFGSTTLIGLSFDWDQAGLWILGTITTLSFLGLIKFLSGIRRVELLENRVILKKLLGSVSIPFGEVERLHFHRPSDTLNIETKTGSFHRLKGDGIELKKIIYRIEKAVYK